MSSTHLSIHDLPAHERPRERLLMHGAHTLTTPQLIAIILGTGSSSENAVQLAERILSRCGGIAGLLNLAPSDLEDICGLGDAKIAKLLAVVEINRRLMNTSTEARPVIREAEDAARLVMDMGLLQREEIRVILLDTSKRL